MIQLLLVHYLLHLQILCRLTLRLVVQCRTIQAHKFAIALAGNACGALLLKLYYLTLSPASSQALAKKSHSSVSWPTFLRSLKHVDLT